MSVKLSETQRKIALTATFLGVLQGCIWGIMALICIALYFGDSSPPLMMETYGDILNYSLYYYLLYKSRIDDGTQTVEPEIFCGYMFVYLIANVVWVGASFYLLLAIRNKSDNLPKALKLWGAVTMLICGIDFIMVVMLGYDYGNMCASFPILGVPILALSATMCANAVLIAMVLAAKGFVLWIINAVLAKVTLTMVKQVN